MYRTDVRLRPRAPRAIKTGRGAVQQDRKHQRLKIWYRQSAAFLRHCEVPALIADATLRIKRPNAAVAAASCQRLADIGVACAG